MLCVAERGRYGKLLEELRNYFTKGDNYYPEDIMESSNILLNYKTPHSKLVAIMVEKSEEVFFGNLGGDKNIKFNKDGGFSEGRGRIKVECYFCGKLDHIARELINQKEAGAYDAGR